MEEKEGSDWKGRQANLEEILKQMDDPSPQLLQQLQTDLLKYIADVNPNCQRTALSICESFFSVSSSINYPQFAHVLIDKCLNNRQQNCDAALYLILRCLHSAHDHVIQRLYEELNSKSPKQVLTIISILTAHLKSGGINDASKIIENLTPLLENRDQKIRKEAANAIAVARGEGDHISAPAKPTPLSPRPKSPVKSSTTEQRSESARRNRSPIHKRRVNAQSSQAIWSSWIPKEILQQLQAPKWQSIVAGFEELKKQYQDTPCPPSAVAFGLSSIFIGRTFTPKVMNQMTQEILFYMKEDTPNLTDDTITTIIHFAVDKIVDKRMETDLFEMMDIICQIMTPPYVFQQLYPHLSAKNYTLPARIVSYFAHVILTFGIESKLTFEEVASQLKPLCSHSDATIRKTTVDCIGAMGVIFGESEVLDYFKFLKPVQINELKKSITTANKFSGGMMKPIAATTRVKPTAPLSMQPTATERKFSPKKIRSNPSKSDFNEREFIPSRLITGIARTSPTLECKKAFEEMEEILSSAKSSKGDSSMVYSDFSALFPVLRQWFKENNTTIIHSVAKVLCLSIHLLQDDEVQNIPNEFLSDIFFLLNYTQKPIKSATLTIISLLQAKHPNFIIDAFLPVYTKLSVDGRKAALLFIKDLEFDMTIEEFLPFIVACLGEKSEDFRSNSSSLVNRFMQLPGASDAIRAYSAQFAPAKKNLIQSQINNGAPTIQAIEPQLPQPQKSFTFKMKPTLHHKNHREQKIDPFLPLRVMNGKEKSSLITDTLIHYGERYFTIEFASTDTSEIESSCEVFLTAADADFESFSLTLDIVFLWWATQSLLIQHQESFEVIFDFLLRLFQILIENQRVLDQFEFSVILPTILECVGRDYQQCIEIQRVLFTLCPTPSLLTVLVHILANVTSVYAVAADFNALLSLLPGTNDWTSIKDELVKTSTRIHYVLAKDPSKNPDLFHIAENFLNYLRSCGAITESDSKPISKCKMNPIISAKLKNPSILVYGWIVDLSSADTSITIQALKSISAQLKEDPSIFEPHLEAMVVSLISIVHSYFASDPPPTRLCKYIAFCLLTLFNETSVKNIISQVLVQQLVYEMLTHMSNGINEAVLNQVLNALILKLIDDCTMFAFTGLLSAIGEFENRDQFTERWIRLGLKCFEACGVRICEIGQDEDIKQSQILLNNFLQKYSIEKLNSSTLGSRIVAVIRSFVELVNESFSEVMSSLDMKEALGDDAEIYKFEVQTKK